jgi:hypothetical protein
MSEYTRVAPEADPIGQPTRHCRRAGNGGHRPRLRRAVSAIYRIGIIRLAAILRTFRVFELPTRYILDRHGVIRDRYFKPFTLEQMAWRIARISQP